MSLSNDGVQIKNIQETILQKFEYGLDQSLSTNRHQAIINMAHYYAKLDIPESLKLYIDNVKDYDDISLFSNIKDLLPDLAQHYHNEAIYKERLKILKLLKIEANSDQFKEIDTHLLYLFKGDLNDVGYKNAILNFKTLIVRARLKHYQLDVEDAVIKEGLQSNNLVAHLKGMINLSETVLNKVCSSFVTLAHLSSPEAIHHKLVNDALTIANDDFKREILVLNDMHETHFSGNERLFRGIRLELTPELQERFFAEGTRFLENNNDLFHFNAQSDWNRSEGNWYINGVYFSFNPYCAMKYSYADGIILEALPYQGKKGMLGEFSGLSETVINNIEGSEISHIYRLENYKIVEIIRNNNFPFEQNEGISEFVHYEYQKENLPGLEQIVDYKFHSWATKKKYISKEDFESQYDARNVQLNRDNLLNERGFISYTEQYKQYENDPSRCYMMTELYWYLANSNEEKRNEITTKNNVSKILNDNGNNLLFESIIHDNVEMLSFSLSLGLTTKGENYLGQNIYQVAAMSGSIKCLKILNINPEIINENRLLEFAIMNRQEKCAIFLIESGANTDVYCENGFKPSHLAVIKHLPQVLSVMIKEGATLENKSDADFGLVCETASMNIELTENELLGHWDANEILKYSDFIEKYADYVKIYASAFLKEANKLNADISILDQLLKKGVNVNVTDKNEITALQNAIKQTNAVVMEYLIENGAEINVKTLWAHLAYIVFSIQNNEKMIQHFIRKGLDVNDKEWNKTAGFLIYFEKNNFEMVEYLLERGADINAKYKENNTALFKAAVMKNDLKATQYLLNKGADINIQYYNGDTVLHMVALQGQKNMIKYLLDHGSDANIPNSHGDTVFHFLANSGDIDLLKYSLKKNDDLNVRNNDGDTPLHWAAGSFHTDVVEYLIEMGMNVNVRNDMGETTMHFAARSGSLEMVEYLVKCGVDVHLLNNKNNTVFHEIANNSFNTNIRLVKYFLEQGVDVNTHNSDGDTVLHIATRNGNIELVQALVENGADLNAQDAYGRTPIHVAVGDPTSINLHDVIEKPSAVPLKDLSVPVDPFPQNKAVSDTFMLMQSHLPELNTQQNETQ